MKNFLLEVNTSDLTRALKHLCKIEKRDLQTCLSYHDRMLTFSLGQTRQGIPAIGVWPASRSVPRKWAETVSANPHDSNVTTLKVEDGQLWACEFRCNCQEGGPEDDEDARNRQRSIDAAKRALERHGVTAQDVIALLNEADPEKAKLWSPDDERMINDIGRAWVSLFSFCVEPSDIRRVLHAKNRDLWISRTKRN